MESGHGVGARSRLAQLLEEAPGDAEAIEFEESWSTWGLLRSASRSLDEVVAGNGLGVGARVGVVLENSPELVAVLVGLIASGRCVVTLSPLQPAERLAADIRRAEVPVVVASADVLGRDGVRTAVEEFGIAVGIGAGGSLEVVGGQVRTEAAFSPDTMIEMLTSGTTGAPKRVRLGDVQFDTALRTSVPEPRPDVLFRKGISIVSTPLVHIGGLWGAVSALYSGRKIVLMPRFSLEPWVRAIEVHRPRAAGLVPAALRTVLSARVPKDKLASLAVVTSGTTHCPPELADE